ncbi:MAG: GDSL-type esterase/lipase family protein [Luteolibacter sp.]|uniref:GDSL-type esterase/lipase family protein n=1 Tax=Luteolibacter sp. TaxID=1962973 RepID=UPI0032672FCB
MTRLFSPLPIAAAFGLAAASTHSAHATLIARDGFNYTAGSALAGATGPIGFSSAYTAANAGCTISSPGFTYGDLSVSGNKVDFVGTNANGNFGVLTNSPETPGTTIYFSYLMRVNPTSGYAGVSLYDGAATETLFTGKRGGTPNVFGLEPKVGTPLNSTVTCSHLSLVVCRIDFAAASATIKMYVNPQSGTEPTTPDLTVTRTSALVYDRIRIQGNGAVGSVDEFRLGDTFADVAPITYGSIPQEIVVCGSSVAAGTGASPQSDGWAYRLGNLLENQSPIAPGSKVAWQVDQASVGGNNTTAVLNRFQADVADARTDANMVIIGLSLANEGLVGAANPQAIFDSFKNGMTQIVAKCRAEGFYPIITLCYPQNGYNANEYTYLKRMNLLLNTWDVPCINLLGAIDDGTGHWAPGYYFDDGHPNSAGHDELFSSIVPSMFDAIVAGKTTQPQMQGTNGYLRLQRDAAVTSPLLFTPSHPVKSFTLNMRVRSTDTGTVAAIGTGANRATLEIRDNSFVYVGPGGAEVTASLDANDGHWHDVALAHRHATGKSLLYVDGQLKGSVNDSYTPDFFSVGGAAGASGRALAPLSADFQDVCIYRAAWTEDEALAQDKGALQQASLEICAPLADLAPVQGAPVANCAQSLSALTLQTANVTPMPASTTPGNLNASSYSSTTVSLTWTDHSNGVAPFTIERRRTGIAEPWTVAGTSPGNSPFFENSGLVAGTSYDYRVSTSEGSLQSDFSNVISILPGGQSAKSYQEWIAGYYTQNTDNSTYLIDFNTNASPAYGTVKWNTVTSTSSATPYPLSDTNNNPSACTCTITDSFDQFRSDATLAPLTGYAAAAQNSQFCLRDDVPLTGSIKIAGLDPTATYDFSFLARRGALVAGFHYIGNYTFTGSGAPVVVTVDAATSAVLTNVPPVTPSASGVVTLTISAGAGTGTPFPVINFLQFKRSNPAVYLVDFNTNASPAYGTVKWNTVTSTSSTTPYPLIDTSQIPSSLTVAITDSFDQFRSDPVAPLAGYAAAAQNSQFCLRDDVPLTGAIRFSGLNPAATYDFSFFARRGSLVAGFHYNGTYTFAGLGAPVVVTVDASTSAVLTNVPPVTPTAAGVVTLTISAASGTGTPFPVINFIQLKRTGNTTAFNAIIAPGADPDGDGISNFQEYARSFNPTIKDATPFQVGHFAMSPSATGVQLEFTRDRSARDVGYTLQKTIDLINWQPDTIATQTVVNRAGTMETVLYESPVTDPAKFFRLRLLDLTPAP